MERETLEDHLRRATRNFTTRLPEDQVLALGRDLARELERAHAESPPRSPELHPAQVPMEEGRPRLEGGRAGGDASEDLFRLGALLHALATGERVHVSWRLDGPPPAALSSLARRAVLEVLASPRRADRYASAAEAAHALDALLQARPDGPAPWPLFRGDPERTGRAAGAPAAAALTASWQARVGPVLSSPAVTADLVIAATADGRLVFLDRGHGRRVHELRIGSAGESSPALADGTAHVGNDDGELVGVDLAAGEERYRIKLGQLVRSSPLPLPGGPVVVGVVEARNAGALVAVDPRKGKPLWARKLAATFSSPARAGERVLVGSDDGALHAVAADTGSLAWSHPIGGKVRATPLVAGELAVVGSFEGRVVAVRTADGTRAWVRELGHAFYSSPCLAGDLVVLGCHEGHLHALDLKTGEPRFEAATRGPVVSSPAALDGGLLAASTDGALYLVDLAGRVVQRTVLAESIQSSPALAAAQAFLGSSQGLHAWSLG